MLLLGNVTLFPTAVLKSYLLLFSLVLVLMFLVWLEGTSWWIQLHESGSGRSSLIACSPPRMQPDRMQPSLHKYLHWLHWAGTLTGHLSIALFVSTSISIPLFYFSFTFHILLFWLCFQIPTVTTTHKSFVSRQRQCNTKKSVHSFSIYNHLNCFSNWLMELSICRFHYS